MAAESDKPPDKRGTKAGPTIEKSAKDPGKLKQFRKQSLVDARQQKGRGGLRPDDIGVVRVEFSVPASRLFGNLSAGRGGVPIVEADNDTDDPVSQFDSDVNDPVITSNPGPGHFDVKDGS